MADKDDKTEEPTGKKLAETRSKGQVAKSQDLSTAVGIITMTISILFLGRRTTDLLEVEIVSVFNNISTWTFSQSNLISLLMHTAKQMLNIVWPFMVTFLVVGLVTNYVQVGWIYSLEKLKPNFDFLTKLTGLKKMFSKNSIVELLKSLAKVAIIGYIIYLVVDDRLEEMLYLTQQDLNQFLVLIYDILFELCYKIALLLIILGLIDLTWQKYNHKQQLKMSKQEVKDERKQSEGDPQVKAKLRRLMQEAMGKAMMENVPQATVVVTNPTFIAIAIQYEREGMTAPLVMAKGKRLIAERIRDLAKEEDIPVVENVPLARGLFDIVEPGDEIPAEFYSAVAEVLAYVYNQKT